MDLLGAILKSSEAEEYIENFKNHEIDTFTLKLLSDADLQKLGVDDEEKRKKLLKYISGLQTPAEKRTNIVFDNQYVLLVLNQISVHLHKHFANLVYAFKRENVDLCNIRLTPAVDSVQNILDGVEIDLDKLERKVCKKLVDQI